MPRRGSSSSLPPQSSSCGDVKSSFWSGASCSEIIYGGGDDYGEEEAEMMLGSSWGERAPVREAWGEVQPQQQWHENVGLNIEPSRGGHESGYDRGYEGMQR